MISKKAGKHSFAIFLGKIHTDSYDATIKKLTFLQQKNFIQLVGAKSCAGFWHLQVALEHCFFALENKKQFSNTAALEFLLCFFGTRQIENALVKSKFEKDESVVLIIEKNWKNAGKIKKKLSNLNFVEGKFEFGKNPKELAQMYGVSEKERGAFKNVPNALEQLIVEKISFLEFER